MKCKHIWLKVKWEESYRNIFFKHKIKGVFYICEKYNNILGATPKEWNTK